MLDLTEAHVSTKVCISIEANRLDPVIKKNKINRTNLESTPTEMSCVTTVLDSAEEYPLHLDGYRSNLRM